MSRVLVLAGTTEARLLCAALASGAAGAGMEVTASLAGRTARPLDLGVATRTGGFGGTHGLERWLVDHEVDAVIDATHPFASVMPHHVAQACDRLAVPRLRLLRPGWEAVDGDRWTRVPALADAPAALLGLGARRVLLTTGRQELAPFTPLAEVGVRFVVRSINPPEAAALPGAEVVLARGPFAIEDEVELLRARGIDALLTKDSGGSTAKLVAARRLGVPVVVVDRPPGPDGGVCADVDGALAWLGRLLAPAHQAG